MFVFTINSLSAIFFSCTHQLLLNRVSPSTMETHTHCWYYVEEVVILLRLFFSFGGESFQFLLIIEKQKAKRHQRTSRYTLYRFDSADVVYTLFNFQLFDSGWWSYSGVSIPLHQFQCNIHQYYYYYIYLSIYYYIALASCACACSSPLLLLLNGYTYKSDRFLFWARASQTEAETETVYTIYLGYYTRLLL